MFLKTLRVCDPEFPHDELQNICGVANKLCCTFLFVGKCFHKAKTSFDRRNVNDERDTRNY